jgi:beta-glucosidase
MRITAGVLLFLSTSLVLAPPELASAQNSSTSKAKQPSVVARSGRIIELHGLRFRDLDKNGVLDPYEDWRLSPSIRARDLVARMTLEEKAGMMMHGTARSIGPAGIAGVGTSYDTAATARLIREVGVNSFITRLGGDPRTLAAENNRLQEIAEATRLGIPLTISTDPRNHFQYALGASVQSGRFSQWPETLGFAAIGDASLVRRFGDIARQEYRATGIEETLSPQADLATEPRWSRINGTFGEDPDLAQRLVEAYVEGFQHGRNGVDSAGVVTVVKHWVGYGAQQKGLDSHSSYGKLADFSVGNLNLHVTPFLGAFAAHVAGVMPTYSILEGARLNGRPLEQVGAGYNRQLLTDLLRKRYGFKGVILTDWAITNDCSEKCRNGSPPGERPTFASAAMPWGVEDLPKVDRFAKAVNAGVDQFGGTEEAQFLVQAVRAGKVAESRINESAYRIAVQKLGQGLFENPYVDADAASRVVGNSRFQAEATSAQRRSLVLLENRNGILPVVARGKRVFLHGVDSATAARYGFNVVSDLSRAEIAIVRTTAPYQTLHPNFVFGAMWHEGDLGFRAGDPEFEEIKRITAAVPTIVTVYLDRPAILTEIKSRAGALIANFGVSDAALLDVVTGAAIPEGKLPFELPSSMQEVEEQRSAVPHDTQHPLYRLGFSHGYSEKR